MNPTLARIYGTGMSKTASAEDLDLNQISAADYLSMLEESGEGESDELDLSQLSAAELLELAGEVDGDDQIEKMASSGDLEYWDAAGRIMAHSYAQEIEKVASGEDDELIDIDDLNAAELVALLESGEYEFVKEAGIKDMASRGLAAMKGYGSKAGQAVVDAALARRARTAAGALKRISGEKTGLLGLFGERRGLMGALKTERGKKAAGRLARGAAETGALYGGAGAGAYGIGKGIQAIRRKRQQRRQQG